MMIMPPLKLQCFSRELLSSESLDNSVLYDHSKKLKITTKIIKKYSLSFITLGTANYPILTEEENTNDCAVLKFLIELRAAPLPPVNSKRR